MELSISKKLLILAKCPEKGRFKIPNMQLHFGLIGAILMEMEFAGTIKIEDKRVIPQRSAKMNDDVLQTIHQVMCDSTKERRIKYWVNKLNRKACKFKWHFIEQMQKERVLKIEHKRFLGLIPYKHAYLLNNRVRANLIINYRKAVLHASKIEKEDVVVLALLRACRYSRLLANERSERKKIRLKLKELLKDNEIAGSVEQSIQEVQAAISTAIVVTTAATAAAGSN